MMTVDDGGKDRNETEHGGAVVNHLAMKTYQMIRFFRSGLAMIQSIDLGAKNNDS
jgi:hypothetical protein